MTSQRYCILMRREYALSDREGDTVEKIWISPPLDQSELEEYKTDPEGWEQRRGVGRYGSRRAGDQTSIASSSTRPASAPRTIPDRYEKTDWSDVLFYIAMSVSTISACMGVALAALIVFALLAG